MRLTTRNRVRIACTALFLPLIVFALLPGRTAATHRNGPQQDECEEADSRLLALLDDCVQQRFKDVDKGFGFRRMISPGDTPHRFKPENGKELKVVDELKTARLNVVLYLAGRSVLGEEPRATVMFPRIKGPASVTSTDQNDLPKPSQLLDQSRQAMLAFQTSSDTYRFAVGKWKFSARPVRATEQSCLDCHRGDRASFVPISATSSPSELQIRRPLRIGDALGVVMYAYERHAK